MLSNECLCSLRVSALLSQGVRVPEDVSIVGFDNMNITNFVSPRITTVSQDLHCIGKKATEHLIDKINGKKEILQIEIPCKIVEKESVSTLCQA